LNYLLASHVWRQDHNGFTHQDPGFIDHVANKKAEVVRVYLPPDANCLLSVMDHCLRSRHYVNVVIAGKHPVATVADDGCRRRALHRGHRHLAVGQQRSGCRTRRGHGLLRDVPRWRCSPPFRSCASTCPSWKIRVVNVVDLMKLQPHTEHPHGLNDTEFDELFTKGQARHLRLPRLPVVDPPPDLPRTNHDNIHVRGYKEEGTITTPFDMTVLNDLDRYHLAMDTIDRLRRPASRGLI